MLRRSTGAAVIGLAMTLFRLFSLHALASTKKCEGQQEAARRYAVTSYVRDNLREDELGPCEGGRQTIRYRGADTPYTVPCTDRVQDFLKMKFCFIFSASRETLLFFATQLTCIIGVFITLFLKVSDTKQLAVVGLQSLVPPSMDPVTSSIFAGVAVVSCVFVSVATNRSDLPGPKTKPSTLRND